MIDLDLEEESEEFYAGGSSYEDYPTNYFTGNMDQLVLIDGQEGDSEDLLTDEEGIGGAQSELHQSALELAKHDLNPQKNIAFGSAYFTARLKIKSEESPIVKVGELVLHRDLSNARMEVIQWKEFER